MTIEFEFIRTMLGPIFCFIFTLTYQKQLKHSLNDHIGSKSHKIFHYKNLLYEHYGSIWAICGLERVIYFMLQKKKQSSANASQSALTAISD